MKNDLVATVVVEGPFEVETEPYTIKADTGGGLLGLPGPEQDDGKSGNNLFVVLIIGAAVAGFVAAGKIIRSRKG